MFWFIEMNKKKEIHKNTDIHIPICSSRIDLTCLNNFSSTISPRVILSFLFPEGTFWSKKIINNYSLSSSYEENTMLESKGKTKNYKMDWIILYIRLVYMNS